MPIITIEQLQAVSLDYLIIGGGTSGLTLAARLTEDENVTVGVIEAGGYHPDSNEINIPGYLGRTFAHPTYDWTFFSVPQKHAANVPIIQPRGKGLGGSSAQQNNFLGMFRPAKEEVDALEKLGNPGWNWASILEYFKKSETATTSDYSSEDAARFAANPIPEFHGTSGPIKKMLPSILMEAHALLFDSAEALGLPRNGEMANGSNVGSMTGFQSIDSKTARRSYSASDYYTCNSERPNFLVVINAHVTKILLEPGATAGHRATGIELISNGDKFTINGVRKDVILSAGTFQTPQILELSGIGSKQILESHGIKSVIDLPGVGENLQDHVFVRSIVEIDPSYETADILSVPEVMAKELERYKEQKGHLANIPASGFLFLASNHLGIKDDHQILNKIVNGFSSENATHSDPTLRSGLQKQYELQKSWLTEDHLSQAEVLLYIGHQPLPTPLPVPGKRYVSLVSAVMHPLSRGTVHIGSPDPLAAPLIDPNYFGNEADMEILIQALKFTTKLTQTAPFGDIVRSYVIPGEEVLTPDEGLEGRMREYIKQGCGPVFHPVGTAAMLPREDGGVVDSSLKVYGTENLRVVDVSILPLEQAAHIQAFAYAIGEKAADILRGN